MGMVTERTGKLKLFKAKSLALSVQSLSTTLAIYGHVYNTTIIVVQRDHQSLRIF